MIKKMTLLASLCWLSVASEGSCGTLPVVDVGLIKTNLLNAKRDFAEQLVHGKRALEQIQHLRSQIEQVDRYLDRFGDPKSVSIDTFNDAVGFLKDAGVISTTQEILKDLSGEEVFKKRNASQPLSRDIVIDGSRVEQRRTKVFEPEVAAQRSFSHYSEVQESVLSRREKLKSELERNLERVKRATTASEVQKFGIITRNLEAQIALTDRELQFAANEALIQVQRNQVDSQIRAKARVQEERSRFRVAQKRNVQLYQFPSKPIPFKR